MLNQSEKLGSLTRRNARALFSMALMLLLCVSLTGARPGKSAYGPHDKAAYLNQTIIDFLRPGLVAKVESGKVAADGTITMVYTLSDPAGLPLDINGVYTPGPITVGYVIGVIPADDDQYTSYVTTNATGAAGTFPRAAADTGGVLTQLDNGKYQYVFNKKAPAGFDATATHTLGLMTSRNMAAFGITNNFSSDVFSFVPNGAKVTKVRDVVRTSSCNGCHDQLSHHGGRRRQVELCVICHQPQSTAATTGVTVDFKVFVHKIHMGKNLPSVKAGKPYAVGTDDWSTVSYPADIRRCETCHDQKSGAVQAANYLTRPSRAACGSCHEDVDFATGKNHPGGPQVSDFQCARCHVPQGDLDFDASIKGAHMIPEDSALVQGVVVSLKKVDGGTSGSKPTVTFTLLDKNKKPLLPTSLTALAFTMAGPTTDFGTTSFGADVKTPGYVRESALSAAKCGADGTCTYAFTHAIPPAAKGTFQIGVEAGRKEVLLPGTTAEKTATTGAKNEIVTFSVDNSPVVARRAVVATAKCQACHVRFTDIHDGLSNQTEYCVMCHNPSNTDIAQRGAAVVAADRDLPPQGVNFNLMVHRIHTGKNLPAMNRGYTVVGSGGSHNDFTDVRYPALDPGAVPGDTRNCSMCHIGNSEQNLPIGRSAVTDPQGPVSPVGATASACTGCHAAVPSLAHALSQTNPLLGESCTVCHKPTAEFGVSKVHAQY